MDATDCDVCLRLKHELMPKNVLGRSRLNVPFKSLLNSPNCTICHSVVLAILGLNGIPENRDSVSLETIEYSSVTILAREGHTTEAMVWKNTDLLLDLELFAKGDLGESVLALGFGSDIHPVLDMSTCASFLTSRVKECDASHARCQPAASAMPSRLLHFVTRGDDKLVRLVDHLPYSEHYVALSHCWGESSRAFTTTKDTLNDRLQHIPWEIIPKTFQDAFAIANSLNIEYVWIDSLCIIQDDENDWRIESLKMADVYSQAYLTIAATGSKCGESGFLTHRWHETDLGVVIPHSSQQALNDEVFSKHGFGARICLRGHAQFRGDLYPPLGGAPLWTRAWAFQERILANRTIHFHGEEMIWECLEMTDCECGFLGWEQSHVLPNSQWDDVSAKDHFSMIMKGLTTRDEVIATWFQIVEDFTKLKITYELDKLPAISGIAKYMATHLESPYIAGIWLHQLAKCLLWRKLPYQQSRRTFGTLQNWIPSWSWASITLLSDDSFGLIAGQEDCVVDTNFSSISLAYQSDAIQSFVCKSDAIIRVTGCVIHCPLIHHHNEKDRVYPSHSVIYKKGAEYVFTDISCTSDVDIDPEEMDVVCLLVGSTEGLSKTRWDESDSGKYIVQYGLVLQVLEPGRYTRVGMFEHDSRKGWFEDLVIQSLEII